MTSANEYADGLAIGTVERVTPGRVEVRLLEDAPHGTSLNSGVLTQFPRINSPLVIPSESGSIVGIATEVEIDRLRHTNQEDLIRTPAPLRRLVLLPLGVIRHDATRSWLERGLHIFPTVGDPVLVPTSSEISALTLTPSTSASIEIGRSMISTRTPVTVDVDRLLTRHLAILGNTGSGKSCSVAVILRAAIEKAISCSWSEAEPRVVILDTNGEYSHCFDDLPIGVRRFAVDPQPGDEAEQLTVPGWLWNSSEWVSFTGASAGAQAPYIRSALALLRSRSQITDNRMRRTSTILSRIELKLRRVIATGPGNEFRERQDEGALIDVLDSASEDLRGPNDDELDDKLSALRSECERIRNEYVERGYWGVIPLDRWHSLSARLRDILKCCMAEDVDQVVHADDPIPFDIKQLAELIELEALEHSSNSALEWVAPLLVRLRALLDDRQIASLAATSAASATEDLGTWLDKMVAPGQVTVIDLSLVPPAVLHLTVAVLTRVIFEAHQRYRRANRRILPTVIIAEEAHHFLHRRRLPSEDAAVTTPELCARSFERIAREGRKLGLSLVVTSQRPSEVSETVLSQCNSFLVHRVVNDIDQTLIRRLIPDSLSSLVNELPALPARTAILTGWACEIPLLVEMAELDPECHPDSQDAPLFEEWSNPSASMSWSDVATHWSHSNE